MNKRQKKTLVRVILSFVLLIGVYLFNDLLDVSKYFELLYIIPYWIIGYDVVMIAIKNILRGKVFDERFLMTLATVAGFFIADYAEAVAVMLFYQVGELFQSIAVGKSRKSIKELMDISPEFACVLRDGEECIVDPSEVELGQTIIVRPGEKVAIDGVIIEGSTSLNLVALTGESLPVDKSVGQDIISGSINIQGVIKVKTTSRYEDSTVNKILELVENSAHNKSRMENFISRFAKYYTKIVVILALFVAVLPPLFMGEWSLWVYRAMMFLVVSCPCALVISVPLSFFGGIGGASRDGILVKGANYLEMLSKVDTFVFDKTGTLTKGVFSVTEIISQGISKEKLLEYTAYAESYSLHPIAQSITAYYYQKIDKNRITNHVELSGYGIRADIDNESVLVGNLKLMEKENIACIKCDSIGSHVYVAVGGVYCGCIVVNDIVKDECNQAINDLKKLGINDTYMLTGDLAVYGEKVAKEVGIKNVMCELLPKQKVEAVEELTNQNRLVAYVGDGINDAPVLMQSHVGISMGSIGSDSAIEASDIVIVNDNLNSIVKAIKIARKTMRIVKQNIIFSLSIKIGVLLLTVLGVMNNMWLAIFADVGVMVIAILNAIRVLKKIK